MRNVLTLVALLLSSTGIFVSLAREELRCRLGLSSTECVATEQGPNATNESNISADPQVNQQNKGLDGAQPDLKSPVPSTAKLMETVDQLREKMTPPSGSEPSVEEAPPSTPPQTDSPAQESPPNIPITSKENAVDTAIMGEPAPPSPSADGAPIAPPAEKNQSNPHTIPVIPAQGVTIPVTPPAQE
ncbi:MAG: hypothetical protein ACK58N_07505 [Synechocystis sp.]|jgi:hypothetical protein